MSAKDDIKALHKVEMEKARSRAARLASRMKRRNTDEPPIDEEHGIGEAEELIRENCEWESYPGMWVPQHSSWSDYSGDFVDQSNGAYWLEKYPGLFDSVNGGHGTVWVGIPHDLIHTINFETLERLRDDFRGLDDYPLLDEEKFSEMEMEAKAKYWEDDGRKELRKELVAQAGDNVLATLAAIYMPDEALDDLIASHDHYDQHMEIETGGNVYFRAERAAETIDNAELEAWAETEPRVASAERRAFFDHLPEFFQAVAKHHPNLRVGDLSDDHLFALFKHLEDGPGESLWHVDEDTEDDPAKNLTFDTYNLDQAIQHLDDDHIRRTKPQDARQLQLPLQQAEALARQLLQAH